MAATMAAPWATHVIGSTRSNDSGSYGPEPMIDIHGANGTKDLGRDPGTYYYIVRAYNDLGAGPSSNEAMVTLSAPIPPTASISYLRTSPGNFTITINSISENNVDKGLVDKVVEPSIGTHVGEWTGPSQVLVPGDNFAIGWLRPGVNYTISLVYRPADAQIAGIVYCPTALDTIKDRGRLVVGTSVPWSPFEYYNVSAGNKIEGVDIDIIARVADEIGVELQIVEYNFAVLLPAVVEGQVDLAISAIVITPYRSLSVQFSDIYYTANLVALVNTSSTIDSLEDLNTSALAYEIGTAGMIFVEDNLSASNILAFENLDLTIMSVINTFRDAAIVYDYQALPYALDPAYALKVGLTLDMQESYGIAMALGASELQGEVNRILAEMQSDGSLQLILEKYKIAE
jgi:polar amino acid transport system substrate-binding protein